MPRKKTAKYQPREPEPTEPRELLAYLKKRARWGPLYTKLVAEGWAEKLAKGEMTQGQVAEQMDCTRRSVGMVYNAYRHDELLAGAGDVSELRSRWLDIYHMSDEELEGVADQFAEWRARHFKTPQRTPYETRPFHRKWIVAILRAVRDGKNLLILSPPRHGKTELLIHFDLFFITKVNPDISIVRVCKSEGLAKKALSSQMDHLENNEELRKESLELGEEFQPPLRSGKSWNSGEYTVATRQLVGLKSPTVAAVGAGGTLLSRDGDIFVVDDIEDQQTVYTAEMREKRRNWFNTDLMSRKVSSPEYSNCVIYIGSRQHPDDIPGHLIDNPEWEVIVETAHDEGGCLVEEPEKPENWDHHTDCVLWPEMRPYSWLMGIKNDPQRGSTYPMIYLNHPQDEEVDVFTRAVVDKALDGDRVTHVEPAMMKFNVPADYYDADGIHHPFKLVAGLDPSGSGYQASFLWAVDLASFKLYAVDFENRLGGGIQRGREILARWLVQYGVRTWVIEENLYHGAFRKDEGIQHLASKEGIQIIPHETGANKWDPVMGVSGIASLMRDGFVSLPYGNVETQSKWRVYRAQLINFSRDGRARGKSGRGRNTNTDIVMASWFPLQTMQRWRRDYLAQKVEDQANDEYPFDPMTDLYTDLYAGVM